MDFADLELSVRCNRSSPLVGRTSRFTARVAESLTQLSDVQLDRVTAGSSVFFDRRWFRMLDALDLEPLVRGAIQFRYVVVSRDTEPVAVCPFLVTRSRSIYFFYSLEKFYFKSWQAELLRMDPGRAGWIRWVSRIVAAYRGVARATGAGTDGWVLAASPLSHRGDIALAPMSADDEQRARDAAIDALEDVARDENLPLCFFGVQEDKTTLRQTLMQRDFEELFLVYDNLLHVPAGGFAEYLDQFRSDARRLFNREIKQSRDAGVRFEITHGLGELSGHFEQLYDSTYSKYGEEHFHHPASFWSALGQYLNEPARSSYNDLSTVARSASEGQSSIACASGYGSHVGHRHSARHAEALVAYDGGNPIGFSLLLNQNGDLWFYRVGRSYDGPVGEAPVYFNLAFYEPVKRAIELGARRIWLGSGAWEAKRRRGAVGHALYNYMWFPRRWARWVLVPYLKTFTQISREQMAAATQPTGYLKARVDQPAGPRPHAVGTPRRRTAPTAR